MKMIKIENIHKDHKKGIHELIEKVNQIDNLGYSLTDEWLDYIIQNTSESIFVSIHGNQLVGIGTCMINEIDSTYATINIVVHPEYRNQGIGSQLYNEVISYAKDKNIKTIDTYIKKRLDNAIKFTEKRDFRTVLYVWKLDLEVNKAKIDSIKVDDMLLTFRKATLKDNQVYSDIINQTFGDQLDENALELLFKDSSVTVYILEIDGQPIGTTTMQLRTSLSIGYIYDVAIIEEYRRRGFGSYMLKRCIEQLKSDNIDIATLTVSGQNKEALSLYHKIGFQEVDIDIVGEIHLD